MRFLRMLLLSAAIAVVVVPIASAGGYTDASYYTPAGTVGQPYSHTIQWKPGTGCPPYGYSVVGGAFPPGLSLSSSGHITGTPTQAGTYTFYVRQTDLCGIEGEGNAPFVITIRPGGPPLSVSSSSAPGGEVDLSYSATLTAAGGANGSHSWSVTSGQLPPGLTLSPDGKLSGAPTTPGTYAFTVSVNDGVSSASKTLTIAVIPGMTFSASPVVPLAEVRTSYSATVSSILGTSGGAPPYKYAPVSGFPFGIGFDSATGTIFGSPRAPGTLQLVISIEDANGATKQATLELVVLPRLHIALSHLPRGTVGKRYKTKITVSGGKDPRWQISGGVPTGIKLNPATGVLKGVPRRAGSFTFTVTVTDALGASVSVRYTLRLRA